MHSYASAIIYPIHLYNTIIKTIAKFYKCKNVKINNIINIIKEPTSGRNR